MDLDSYTVPHPPLEKHKDVLEDTAASPGSSNLTAIAAIYHFGEATIECPIVEENVATMTEEDTLKLMSTAMISFLLRSKNLKDDLAKVEALKKAIEQEKIAQKDAWRKEKLEFAAKEKELASLQAKSPPLARDLLVQNVTFRWYDQCYAENKQGGERVWQPWCCSGCPREAGEWQSCQRWLVEAIFKAQSRCTLHEEMVNRLMHLSTDQPLLFNSLCTAIVKMCSPIEITLFLGDVSMILTWNPSEELRVPELSDKNIRIELASDDDSSKVTDSMNSGAKDKEPGVEKDAEKTAEPTPTPGLVEETNENQSVKTLDQRESSYFESNFTHRIHVMILDENQAKTYPMCSMIANLLRKREVIHNIRVVEQLEKDILDAIQAYNVQIHSQLMNSLREKEEEMQRRLHQYDLDYQNSLMLGGHIVKEVAHLKEKNAKLKADKGITVSPWFLEKHHILSIVKQQIKVRIEHFIATINLLTKRTQEVEFLTKQSSILQNLVANHEIPLSDLRRMTGDEDPKRRITEEEFLLRMNKQDLEILDLKDKLNQCINKCKILGFSGVIMPSHFNPSKEYILI
ncbi:OLC1v1000981C1 [Oldenlandia corymbosa var. corymbosa]|uniref:OLC1v1000981C1 n=1 Tax=Oldenlandia corymbosa var. corymbosa TaxID=529605 RepID=A0AAV1D4B7_OLDCO|nr:OLC1v1000981C1 [Oldenlandia corymbosa var. corymbosa]